MPGGPQPLPHTERWKLVEQIATQLQEHYGESLLALGVYGSLARGTDGPYSDIEMHCVIQGEGIDTSFEWSAGSWKAEVDVYSPDVILAQAAEVDGNWAITHGAFVVVQALYDPTSFFNQLSLAVFSQPQEVLHQRMEEVIVGEMYELVGKVRNAAAGGNISHLPHYCIKLAEWGACLLGLRHRKLYSTSGKLFEEALTLSDPPEGFASICQMAASGKLDDPQHILQLTNQFWLGVEAWATRQGLQIETTLDDLLREQE